MNKVKHLIACALIISLSLIATPFLLAQPPTPVLVVGIDENYPPYEFTENGTPTGFNVDLVNAVATEIGYKVEFVAAPWTDVREMLANGEIDILAGMFQSEQRDIFIDFSTPYLAVTNAVFVREDSDITEIDQIQDKEILVERGDLLHEWLLEQGISRTIIPVANTTEALTLLASGQYDCAVLSKYQGLYLINQLSIHNLKSLDEPIVISQYCFAAKEGSQELLAHLNEGLAIVRESGEYDLIYNKWFAEFEPWYSAEWVKYVGYGLAASSLLLIFVIMTNYSLRRRVQQRTDELELELEEKRQIQASLQIYAQDLERSNRELSIFSYAASHDLQAPLRKIIAFCSRIQQTQSDVLDEQSRDYLERALDSAKRMQVMLQTLLSYASITPDENLYAITELDLALADALNDLELLIEESGATIISAPLPAIEGDRGLLSQLFANLLNNSIKFAKQDISPEISIRAITTDTETIITIQDNGIGFDNTYALQMFGLFQRLHGQSEYEGHGMGLAICRKIVETHHGSITAHSGPGQGATFTITLPLVQPLFSSSSMDKELDL